MLKKYKKIALIMAMKGEALPIIEHFQLKRIATHDPIVVYANTDQNLILCLNGTSKEFQVDNIGTQAAAINAYITIHQYSPDLIINCGTAGGFHSKGAKIADSYISTEKICFHDRRIDLPGGFQEYGLGNYDVMNSEFLAKKFDLKQGIISSSDALDYTKKDEEVFLKNNASIKDMEAGSIAWICNIYSQKFFCLKTITDLVDIDDSTSDAFLGNFEKATIALKNKLIDIINEILE